MGNNDAPAALLWSTSKLVKTNSMFKNAVAFDQDIGVVTADKWNVGNVVDMTSMFEGAIFYNNDNNVLTGKLLNLWDVGKVTSFMNMFKGALRYNSHLLHGRWILVPTLMICLTQRQYSNRTCVHGKI